MPYCCLICDNYCNSLNIQIFVMKLQFLKLLYKQMLKQIHKILQSLAQRMILISNYNSVSIT